MSSSQHSALLLACGPSVLGACVSVCVYVCVCVCVCLCVGVYACVLRVCMGGAGAAACLHAFSCLGGCCAGQRVLFNQSPSHRHPSQICCPTRQ